jgi:hypothetical protein
MKSCCKTGDESSLSKIKKWGSRITWGIVILLVTGLALIQVFNL